MRVGRGWIPCNGGAIGSLGFGQIAGFLQRMPELHPDRRIVGITVERPPVEVGGDVPLQRLARTIGATDQAASCAFQAAPNCRVYCCGSQRSLVEFPRFGRCSVLARGEIVTFQLAELTRGIGKRGIEHQSASIRQTRFHHLPLELQHMPKLEVRLGVVRLIGDRIAIGCFRGGAMAALLQRMTVLYPDRRVARLTVERDAIKAGGGFPLSRLAGAVGAADDRRLAAVIAMEQRHRVLLD